MKKLTALTVCVGYSDFLCWTITENKHLFDQWIIVTDTKDTKTKELCDNHNVMCIQTDVFYENGSIFNKYAGINEGLKHVDKNSWILFLDGDIVLHGLTKYILEKLPLDEKNIYGIDRVNCIGLENWLNYIAKRDAVFQNWLLHTSGMPLGARLVHYFGEARDEGIFLGWRPLGFFQLCHMSAFDHYPQKTIGADHCDLEFVRNWKRENRVLIPELIGIHLESEGAYKGVNWYGRKSLPFEIGVKETLMFKIKSIWWRIYSKLRLFKLTKLIEF
jgi:hypothetical protein